MLPTPPTQPITLWSWPSLHTRGRNSHLPLTRYSAFLELCWLAPVLGLEVLTVPTPDPLTAQHTLELRSDGREAPVGLLVGVLGVLRGRHQLPA